MKRLLTLFALTSLLLTACGGLSIPKQDALERVSITATPSQQPIKTSTPIPMGTWETVIKGKVYDRSEGAGKPIVGASISYNVIHSYFSELQEGRPNKSTTDQFGKFELPVLVHDTDSIKILVEAQGYIGYEEKLTGIDLFGGRNFDIGLTPD